MAIYLNRDMHHPRVKWLYILIHAVEASWKYSLCCSQNMCWSKPMIFFMPLYRVFIAVRIHNRYESVAESACPDRVWRDSWRDSYVTWLVTDLTNMWHDCIFRYCSRSRECLSKSYVTWLMTWLLCDLIRYDWSICDVTVYSNTVVEAENTRPNHM